MKKSNIPTLRFPEFKGCGEWEEKTLGDVVTSLEYGMNAAATTFDGVNKYIRITDIDGETGNYLSSKPVSPQGELSDKYLVRQNDILFARTGASTGKTYLYKKADGKLYFAGFLIRGSVIDSHNSYFIYVLTQQNAYSKWIVSVSMRSGQPGVNAQQYSSYSFSVPSLPEQQKIADCLSSLDESINAHTKKFDLLKEYKKGLLQKLFPHEGQKIPEYRFPEFKDCGEWEECTFSDLAIFHNGRAYKQEELLSAGKYKVLRVGNFFSNNAWYYSDLELDENKYCEDGDLLYAWSASFGPRIWHAEKVIYHYHIWKVSNDKDVYKDFLYVLLEKETQNMKSRSANGMGLMHITKGTIEQWKCYRPPNKQEQEKIADCLSTIDKKIEAQSEKIQSLKEHKKGLMQQLFPC